MARMNHGDLRQFVSGDMYRVIHGIINQKSKRREPYYILVNVKPYYQGQPAVNRIENGVAVQNPGKEMEIKGCVSHTVITVLEKNQLPPVPQLGTILWKVDNRIGQVKLCYALPADIPNPTPDSDNDGEVSVIAAESAEKADVPLVWN